MNKGRWVSLNLVNGSTRDYIIRDNVGITIGRIYIIEIDNNNKSCLFRLKFYKGKEESYYYLKDTITLISNILFKNNKVNKVNVLCREDINLNAFTNLGFELEGIISDNIINKSKAEHELLFGINKNDYERSHIEKELILEGENIYLKVLTPQDSEQILNYYVKNREYLTPFEPLRDESFYTLEEQTASLIESYKQFIKGQAVHFGIYKDGKFIGRIKINNIVMGVFRNAFIGYSIDENEQGKGYMKEAVKLAIDYAYDELELHRIEASTMVSNEKSQRVLKSCGFQELGVSKEYLYIDGKWQDHIIFYRNRK
ncbi:MAG: GNAT family N-acetyltransferase [Clostridium argentinense]|uniref:GNAT family N-acetyltransferase n=1 Tax=Clostridium faecium TaxID=2762223 RepID=A0ABR8YXC1_9CLOT|nr:MULTISPECIES: GNAT family protein [Clostridium]MBD8048886.1 GNAT family N-acetyltransferase [Clostridium faecium]MBS5824202.1 GNAT family N-acetyltransferase [Clostridium argentinense]MDU1350811.1 GNAT family protein [Clostridium argentinense]